MMVNVIQEKSELVKKCEYSFVDSTTESALLEDKLRLANLLRSDREILNTEG